MAAKTKPPDSQLVIQGDPDYQAAVRVVQTVEQHPGQWRMPSPMRKQKKEDKANGK